MKPLGSPPVLNFEYETLLDGRGFEPPANYALLRIAAVGEACLEDCLDETKPPVIIIDPRAGHGPGIGGFKRDSEVGIAMHTGHPVYFAIFFPEPCPGQTPVDVLHALRRVVDGLLNNVAPRGRVVFVDYHVPSLFHPLKGSTSILFDCLEPFAKTLRHREVSSFATMAERFAWRKETYFGGFFQKMVAERSTSAAQTWRVT